MKFFFIAIPFLVSPLWSQVEVAELPEDLAKKTTSLNPQFLIFGKSQATEDKKIRKKEAAGFQQTLTFFLNI